MGNASTCRRCRVSGRVQGVGYRAFAARRARELGLTGYARNLPDGSVEVLSRGPLAALDTFCDWLRKGPPQAQVTAVECQAAAEEGLPPDFSVL